jgi:Restriction endonuclease
MTGDSASASMMSALRVFDATDANVAKIERLWREIEPLIPTGNIFNGDDDAEYDRLRYSIYEIIEALPLINGWKPSFELLDRSTIFSMHIDASEVGDVEALINVANQLDEPAREIRKYRFELDRERRSLVQRAIAEYLPILDDDVKSVRSIVSPDTALSSRMEGERWEVLQKRFNELAVLLGSNSKNVPGWSALRRHLSFGLVQDFNDIERSDWPTVKASLVKGIFGENEPIPVAVRDLADIVASKPSGPITSALSWSALDDDAFERLIFNLISDAPGYENPQWLTKTRAADRGRDLSVMRVISDPLSGVVRQHVVIQCRHWLSKSINMADVAMIKEQMALWDPPADELVIATSGRFSTDAIQWIERNNSTPHSVKIRMWPESHLERILASRPTLIAEFGLR